MDNPRQSVSLRSFAEQKLEPERPWQWNRDGWIRLIGLTIKREGEFAFLSAKGGDPTLSYNFGWAGEVHFTADDPVYCRRAPSGTGEYELSFLPINSSRRVEGAETILVIRRALTANQVRRWQEAKQGDAAAQNYVGMSLSYHRANDLAGSVNAIPKDIDWLAAEHWFRLSAAQAHWAGHHNLGVMHLRGEGASKDDGLAFHHLSIAAESGKAPSLYRLADMFEHGIGVEPSPEEAARLRALGDSARGLG